MSWESVLRIDGMIKLLLEQYRVSYLPIESVSMQERVRAVEFVLHRSAMQPAAERSEDRETESVASGARSRATDTSVHPSVAAMLALHSS